MYRLWLVQTLCASGHATAVKCHISQVSQHSTPRFGQRDRELVHSRSTEFAPVALQSNTVTFDLVDVASHELFFIFNLFYCPCCSFCLWNGKFLAKQNIN